MSRRWPHALTTLAACAVTACAADPVAPTDALSPDTPVPADVLVDLLWDTSHSPATSVWYLLVLFLCTMVGLGLARLVLFLRIFG